jgi:hypothetical protein
MNSRIPYSLISRKVLISVIVEGVTTELRATKPVWIEVPRIHK